MVVLKLLIPDPPSTGPMNIQTKSPTRSPSKPKMMFNADLNDLLTMRCFHHLRTMIMEKIPRDVTT